MTDVFKINIFGNTYTLKTDATETEIQKITDYINTKMQDIARENPALPSYKISILAMINITDELMKLKSFVGDDDKKFKLKITELTDKIDNFISKFTYADVEPI